MCASRVRYFGNKLNTTNIVRSVTLGHLEINFEQKILNVKNRKFCNVVVIRPKAVLTNLWAAGLCSKFPQLYAVSQQALSIQPALGYC